MKNSKLVAINVLVMALSLVTFFGLSSFTKSATSLHTIGHTKTDAQFLTQVAQINLDEIQLGQLAQKKSMNPDVKQLGELMEKNHKQSLSELTTLAIKKGISLPTSVTSEANEEYRELSNKSEKKFNDEYCEMMIKGHKHAIALFEAASRDSKDSDIKAWAAATLPTLRMHLEHSKLCKAKCEKV